MTCDRDCLVSFFFSFFCTLPAIVSFFPSLIDEEGRNRNGWTRGRWKLAEIVNARTVFFFLNFYSFCIVCEYLFISFYLTDKNVSLDHVTTVVFDDWRRCFFFSLHNYYLLTKPKRPEKRFVFQKCVLKRDLKSSKLSSFVSIRRPNWNRPPLNPSRIHPDRRPDGLDRRTPRARTWNPLY